MKKTSLKTVRESEGTFVLESILLIMTFKLLNISTTSSWSFTQDAFPNEQIFTCRNCGGSSFKKSN